MKLHCYQHENFGDAPLNRWLWPQLLPGVLDDDSTRLLVGIGSLLNDGLPRAPVKAIVGTGMGYGAGLPVVDESWRVYFVRGPRTAQALGLDPALGVCDAGLLVNSVPLPPPAPAREAAYMPHWYSAENGDWRAVCELAGIHYIDPLGGVETVLSEIRAAKLLITEALHGAIVADALRVPWAPVRAYKHILEVKWLDWCEALGLDYAPHPLRPLYGEGAIRKRLGRTPRWARLERWAAGPAAWAGRRLEAAWAEQNARALRRLRREARPCLSSEAALRLATERMLSAVDRLRGDYHNGRLN